MNKRDTQKSPGLDNFCPVSTGPYLDNSWSQEIDDLIKVNDSLIKEARHLNSNCNCDSLRSKNEELEQKKNMEASGL